MKKQIQLAYPNKIKGTVKSIKRIKNKTNLKKEKKNLRYNQKGKERKRKKKINLQDSFFTFF